MIQKQVCMTEQDYLAVCNRVEKIHIEISSALLDVENNNKAIQKLTKAHNDSRDLMVDLGWVE